jgi:hypothetical protein
VVNLHRHAALKLALIIGLRSEPAGKFEVERR